MAGEDTTRNEYVNTSFSGYEPTDWTCGDVVTAEKLNKSETQLAYLGGGTLPIGVSYDENNIGTLDKTAREIKEAIEQGRLPLVLIHILVYTTEEPTTLLSECYGSDQVSSLCVENGTIYIYTASGQHFVASSLDEYPTTA